jgi:hypothetical protein
MTDKTVSAMTAASALTGAELLYGVQSSADVKVTGAQVAILSRAASTGPLGFATGAGGAVTQITSRTTGVTLNTACGAITLFAAAGSATAASFTVTNSAVAATDVVNICCKSSTTNKYVVVVTAVAAGSFEVTFFTTGGTTSDSPVFNFAIIKAVTT